MKTDFTEPELEVVFDNCLVLTDDYFKISQPDCDSDCGEDTTVECQEFDPDK